MQKLGHLRRNVFLPIETQTAPPPVIDTNVISFAPKGFFSKTTFQETTERIRRELPKDITTYSYITSHRLLSLFSKEILSPCPQDKMEAILKDFYREHIATKPPTEEILFSSSTITSTCLHALETGVKMNRIANILIRHLSLAQVSETKLQTSTFCIALRLINKEEFQKITKDKAYDEQSKAIQAWIQQHPPFTISSLDLSDLFIEIIPSFFLKKLPSLTNLSLQGNAPLAPALLDSIAELSSLEELDLSYCGQKTLSFDLLAKLEYLRVLHLEGNNFSQEEQELLRNYCTPKSITIFF
ncbi:MAG: hypothetical protein FJZ58_01325 [Chlamydiae bacterium]|nr:hypothetical protein [Chlamydiota bacterium]